MKLILKLISIIFTVAIMSAAINSCKKEDEGTVTVITSKVSEITYHSAVSGVEWSGSDEILAEGGICYSQNPKPTINDSVSQFDVESRETASDLWFGPLVPNTTYHIRAYINKFTGSSVRTFYGQEVQFATLEFNKTIKFNPSLTYGTVSDIEGNFYKTIKIGTQVWMAENLRTTRFNDNTLIPKAAINSTLMSDIRPPAYNWYEEDSVNYSTTYGAIYNWFTVNTGRLCPAGWHVPSDNEWESFVSFLGGPDAAAIKMKETGIIHWNSPNDGATNEAGFTALPGLLSGSFEGWWSTTTRPDYYDPPMVWCYYLSNDIYRLTRSVIYRNSGMNVRCIQD